MLQVLVDGTSVARTVHSAASYPVGGTDPLISAHPGPESRCHPGRYAGRQHIRCIARHRTAASGIARAAVFAIGSMSQPQVIVSAMRAGAKEFIERPTTTTDLLEAFVRLSIDAAQGRSAKARAARFSPSSTPRVAAAPPRSR